MPSLFNRVRTSSAKTLQATSRDSEYTSATTHVSVQFDEFGQDRAQSSFWPDIRSSTGFKSKTTSSARQRTLSAPSPPKDTLLPHISELPPLPLREDSFHPLYIPPKREEGDRPYGYLCAENGVILGLPEFDRLVDVVCQQIVERGTHPRIFAVSCPLTSTFPKSRGDPTPLLLASPRHLLSPRQIPREVLPLLLHLQIIGCEMERRRSPRRSTRARRPLPLGPLSSPPPRGRADPEGHPRMGYLRPMEAR